MVLIISMPGYMVFAIISDWSICINDADLSSSDVSIPTLVRVSLSALFILLQGPAGAEVIRKFT